MMKALVILFFLLSLTTLSQTKKIKVKKDLSQIKQSELPFLVTICDKYAGSISRKEILTNNKLAITNNTEGLKVISYDMVFKARGKLCIHANMQNDSINLIMQKNILLCDNRTHVLLQDIKAVSKNNDTIFLNPISLKIED